MKTLSIESRNILFIMVLLMIPVSCQSNPSPSLSSTSASITSTPSPTTPTETPSPQPTNTPLPTATLALVPQDFYGIWSIFDSEAAGLNYFTFQEDGSFTASHGPEYPAIILHQGTYTLNGNELTFNDWWFCPEDQRVGIYLIKMYPDNQSVRFYPINDPCEERAYDFTNRIIKWNRFVSTPTPSP